MNKYEKIYNMLTEAEGDKPGTEDPFSDLWNQQATAGEARSTSGSKRSQRTKDADDRAAKKRTKDTARRLARLLTTRRARRMSRKRRGMR